LVVVGALPLNVAVAPEGLVPLIVMTVPAGPDEGLKLVIVGGERGVAELEGPQAAPWPLVLVAVTVKV